MFTRTTHAYYASRRSKRHVRMGHAAQVSGIACLVIVGVQTTVQNNGSSSSELTINFNLQLHTCSLTALFRSKHVLGAAPIKVLFFYCSKKKHLPGLELFFRGAYITNFTVSIHSNFREKVDQLPSR